MNDIQKNQIKTLRLQGAGYSKIARSLGLSENTVKSYCKRNSLGSVTNSQTDGNKDQNGFCKNCGITIS